MTGRDSADAAPRSSGRMRETVTGKDGTMPFPMTVRPSIAWLTLLFAASLPRVHTLAGAPPLSVL